MKMKRNRTLVSTFIATILLTFALAGSASANTGATENFHVYINGGSVVSSQVAYRAPNYFSRMSVWVDVREGSTVKWLRTENVNLRGRTANGTKATELLVTNTPLTGEENGVMNYLSGHGTVGAAYRLAVQYASDNPYKHLDLTAHWQP